MKNTTSLLSLLFFLSLLTGCNASHQLNCNDDEIAFQHGARHGNLEMMKKTFATGKVGKNAHCKDHNTALMEAVTEGHLENVRYLLEELDVDPNILDKTFTGWLPLHYAARDGKLEIARLLLAKGARVNSKANLKGVTPLHLAAINGHTEIARLLLQKGDQANSTSNHGNTPLHYAAFYGKGDTAIFLLE